MMTRGRWLWLQYALCAAEWGLFAVAVARCCCCMMHHVADDFWPVVVACACLGADALLQLAFVVCRRTLRAQQRRTSVDSVMADHGAEEWHDRFLWLKAMLAHWLGLWLIFGVGGGLEVQVFGSELITAIHGLHACTTLLMAHALARADTDGTPGELLLSPQQRAWLVPHGCAWWLTGMQLLDLGVLRTADPRVWVQVGLLVLICLLETQQCVECARVIESPVRFEQVFCTAAQLCTGDLGVKASVDEEEGGVILSFTRADRLRVMRARHETLRLCLWWAVLGAAACHKLFF